MFYALNTNWSANIGDGSEYPMNLPGTLDENCIGHKDTGANRWHPDINLGNQSAVAGTDTVIATRFTRKYTYEGEAVFTGQVHFEQPEGQRVFLEAERARCLRLRVDGKEVPDFAEPTLSTPHIFEITDLSGGDHEVQLVSDNSYPGLPHDDIVDSSAATDETQTNWNGVLGYLRLRTELPVFITSVRVYPQNTTLTVRVEISAAEPYRGVLTLNCDALKMCAAKEIAVQEGRSEIIFEALELREDVKKWDEYEGNLYEMTASPAGLEAKTVSFGVREFGAQKGRLALNGRIIFLRSEANCAEFPEIGHPPMTVEEWTDILKRYQSYGINCMRFHSHCPPEAAFTAADRLGLMMQPELSHWNPRNAFSSPESFAYYQAELRETILFLANHPSFVMMTLGNELWADETGHTRMKNLLAMAHELDTTRLYANGSNIHYGTIGCDENSDFYTSSSFFNEDLRGTYAGTAGEERSGIRGYLNKSYPNSKTGFDAAMKKLRAVYKKPVFSFEVGQFEVLPDFDELEAFHGISDPANLRLVQKRVKERGIEPVWKKYVETTGELSRICYREEIEAAMRTEGLSGISLLGLQDFPGQGTSLVGMMNSHLEPKPFPFAQPEAFQSFFRDQLPLVYLPRYTFENTETLTAEVKMANYGKQEIRGCLRYELREENVRLEGTLPEAVCPMGRITGIGTLHIPLQLVERSRRLDLTVAIGGIQNTYPVWVYLPAEPVCPQSVYEAEYLDDQALEVLEMGGSVFLSPPSTKEALPESIQAQFSTDFWSVGTFPGQDGGMGQLIDESHPIFEEFPTESYTNWQWWPMAVQRAVILPDSCRNIRAIVTEMDSYAYLRPMAQLLECRCGNGRVMLSTLDLKKQQRYPEARALLNAIYRYMDSERFVPEQEISAEVIAEMVKPGRRGTGKRGSQGAGKPGNRI